MNYVGLELESGIVLPALHGPTGIFLARDINSIILALINTAKSTALPT